MPDRQDPVAHLRRDLVFEADLPGGHYRFATTWGLFSPRAVDDGSRLLLRHVEVAEDADCLDLGCGYGVLGVVLARLAPRGRTVLVDKDFVAVDYARRNLATNGIGHGEALLSNGFDGVRGRHFDTIVANLPAKVGKELLTIYLHDARSALRPGGALWMVTVTGLRRFIERMSKEVFGDYDKVKQGPAYTVAVARKR
ncbi:MAG: methyltransferase [Gammaproteobacteria bacterium]|nr:methyltransferase [Gammaproteobacteria bacterium]